MSPTYSTVPCPDCPRAMRAMFAWIQPIVRYGMCGLQKRMWCAARMLRPIACRIYARV